VLVPGHFVLNAGIKLRIGHMIVRWSGQHETESQSSFPDSIDPRRYSSTITNPRCPIGTWNGEVQLVSRPRTFLAHEEQLRPHLYYTIQSTGQHVWTPEPRRSIPRCIGRGVCDSNVLRELGAVSL